MSKNAAKCCKMCLHFAKIRTRARAIALQRVLNILRYLLASFVWFRVSLVAVLFPLYLSIGIFGRRFRVILLFFHFFSEKPVFFSLFLSNSRKIWEKCAEMMKRRPSSNEDERISRASGGNPGNAPLRSLRLRVLRLRRGCLFSMHPLVLFVFDN